MVRALNDNLASIIYNSTSNLPEFFYVGLGVCVFSTVCALVLTQIHKAVIESKDGSLGPPAGAQPRQKLPKILISNKSGEEKLPR